MSDTYMKFLASKAARAPMRGMEYVMFWLSDCGFPVAIVKDIDHALSFLAANGVPLKGRVS